MSDPQCQASEVNGMVDAGQIVSRHIPTSICILVYQDIDLVW